MAETTAKNHTNNPPKEQPKKRKDIPVVSFILNGLLKGIGVCVFAGFISVVLEFGLFYFSDNPVQDSYTRFEAVAQFNDSGSWFNEKKFFDVTQDYILNTLKIADTVKTLRNYTDSFASHIVSKKGDNKYLAIMKDWAHRLILAIPDLVTVWIVSTFTWLAKMLSIFAMLLPAAIILVGGFIDGSVQRKIDTFRGKRVSQDKIEWWFLAFKFTSYSLVFIYVAIPNELEAGTVILPTSVLSAIFCRNVVANYKKYV